MCEFLSHIEEKQVIYAGIRDYKINEEQITPISPGRIIPLWEHELNHGNRLRYYGQDLICTMVMELWGDTEQLNSCARNSVDEYYSNVALKGLERILHLMKGGLDENSHILMVYQSDILQQFNTAKPGTQEILLVHLLNPISYINHLKRGMKAKYRTLIGGIMQN